MSFFNNNNNIPLTFVSIYKSGDANVAMCLIHGQGCTCVERFTLNNLPIYVVNAKTEEIYPIACKVHGHSRNDINCVLYRKGNRAATSSNVSQSIPIGTQGATASGSTMPTSFRNADFWDMPSTSTQSIPSSAADSYQLPIYATNPWRRRSFRSSTDSNRFPNHTHPWIRKCFHLLVDENDQNFHANDAWRNREYPPTMYENNNPFQYRNQTSNHYHQGEVGGNFGIPRPVPQFATGSYMPRQPFNPLETTGLRDVGYGGQSGLQQDDPWSHRPKYAFYGDLLQHTKTVLNDLCKRETDDEPIQPTIPNQGIPPNHEVPFEPFNVNNPNNEEHSKRGTPWLLKLIFEMDDSSSESSSPTPMDTIKVEPGIETASSTLNNEVPIQSFPSLPTSVYIKEEPIDADIKTEIESVASPTFDVTTDLNDIELERLIPSSSFGLAQINEHRPMTPLDPRMFYMVTTPDRAITPSPTRAILLSQMMPSRPTTAFSDSSTRFSGRTPDRAITPSPTRAILESMQSGGLPVQWPYACSTPSNRSTTPMGSNWSEDDDEASSSTDIAWSESDMPTPLGSNWYEFGPPTPFGSTCSERSRPITPFEPIMYEDRSSTPMESIWSDNEPHSPLAPNWTEDILTTPVASPWSEDNVSTTSVRPMWSEDDSDRSYSSSPEYAEIRSMIPLDICASYEKMSAEGSRTPSRQASPQDNSYTEA